MDDQSFLSERIEKWLEDTNEELNISSLELKEWPKLLKGKEHLIIKLDFSGNKITCLREAQANSVRLPNRVWTNLEELYCCANGNEST